MNFSRKLAGTAVLVGGILNLTRMVPIIAGGNVDVQNFPPQTTAQLISFVNGNLSGHLISHIMALISFLLLMIGFLSLYQELSLRKEQNLALPFIVIAGAGLGLNAIAVIIDGFVTPLATQNAAGGGSDMAVFLAAYTHDFALIFFGLATFALLTGIGLLSLALIHDGLYPRWLSWIGALLGLLGFIGYVSGAFGGLRLENFQLAGLVTMLSYLWLVLLGITMLRAPHARESEELHPALS